MIKSATVVELRAWLEKGDAVLVDVRQPEEYAEGHIEGAVLIPLATLSAQTIPAFKGKKLVMQCHLGGRSHTACLMLSKAIDNLEVYNLEGGLSAWEHAGYEIKH